MNVQRNIKFIQKKINMLPINGIVPTKDDCIVANKSAHIFDYGTSCMHLHNIATYKNENSEIIIFNREIDEETLEVIDLIINFGNHGKSPYLNTKIYCCRDIGKRINLENLKRNPKLKNIEIYQHMQKDVFHDRYLMIKHVNEQTEIYLMGNSISSFKKTYMNIAQVTGECITHLDTDTTKNFNKSLIKIIKESKQIYPKVEIC